jgi:hypothetical protein
MLEIATLVDIVSIKPYTSVDAHFFYLFYAGVDGTKVVLNSHQQHPPHLTFAHPE